MNSSLVTNEKNFGGKFSKQFSKDLSLSNGLQVATGYFGHDLITSLEKKLVKLGKNGSCKLLLGMAFQKSPAPKQLDILKLIDTKLRENNPDNGVYIRRKKYHGKIYKFSYEDDYKIYLGSSNFSNSGFNTNTECNIEVDNVAYSNANWTQIDPLVSFSNNCNFPVGCFTHTLIEEITPNISLYPNPTNNGITLDIEGYNGLVNVEVYDFTGKLLKTTTNTTISMQEYAKGIYVFKVAYGDSTQELKVVKD